MLYPSPTIKTESEASNNSTIFFINWKSKFFIVSSIAVRSELKEEIIESSKESVDLISPSNFLWVKDWLLNVN